MTDATRSKTPEGRRRVRLDELYARWNGPDKKLVEKNLRRSEALLFEEMVEFEPVGFVTPTRLLRFFVQYKREIPFLFVPPFIPAMTPANTDDYTRRRAETLASLKIEGAIRPTKPGPTPNAAYLESVEIVHTVARTRTAYDLAYQHRWKRNGGTGEPPLPPGWDYSACTERELAMLRENAESTARNAAFWTEHKARELAAGVQPTLVVPPTLPRPTPASGQRVDWWNKSHWTDNVTWDGMKQRQSPREMMRPTLERIGRLDLLEGYSDEIVRYGPVVRRMINGTLR